jgi:glutamine synthetase
VATDHNQIVMETMRKVAERHDLVCLLHEKPFAGMNGSGKHNNWSVTTDVTGNLLDPGDQPETNYCFLLFLVCVIAGVDEYADLLRLSVATASNDHRLGGNEAPPAIISIFLGEEISSILEAMITHKDYTRKNSALAKHGVKFVADFTGDRSDRNRTSPFAFTGTKFEFRMPGSSMNISCANIMLNTAVADVIQRTCDALEKTPSQENIKSMIAKLYTEHKRILFDGNGYSAE